MVYNFGHVCPSVFCMSVCLSVCQMITVESLDLGSSYLHIRYISRKYGSSFYMKVIVSRSRSQEQKSQKSLFPQCITSIGNNLVPIKHRIIKFACSMAFSAMVDWMVRLPSLSRDRKWPHVIKCTHSQVVGLRLEGNLDSTLLFESFIQFLLQLIKLLTKS